MNTPAPASWSSSVPVPGNDVGSSSFSNTIWNTCRIVVVVAVALVAAPRWAEGNAATAETVTAASTERVRAILRISIGSSYGSRKPARAACVATAFQSANSAASAAEHGVPTAVGTFHDGAVRLG